MDKSIFTFQRLTGCRPNEARGLLRENIHWDKGIPIIATVRDSHGMLRQRTKTGKLRVLPIIPEIEDVLKSKSIPYVFTRNGVPYGKRTHENIWKKANQQAHQTFGVPLVGQYAGSKHSFGMQRLNAGFTTDQLQAVFGHADIKSTQQYAQYLTKSLTPVVRGRVNMARTLLNLTDTVKSSIG